MRSRIFSAVILSPAGGSGPHNDDDDYGSVLYDIYLVAVANYIAIPGRWTHGADHVKLSGEPGAKRAGRG